MHGRSRTGSHPQMGPFTHLSYSSAGEAAPHIGRPIRLVHATLFAHSHQKRTLELAAATEWADQL